MAETTRYPWLRSGQKPTKLDEFEASARERANDPWKPRPDYDSPAPADDAGPVETMLADAAAHRQFMASVASPGPRLIGSVGEDGGRRRAPNPPEPELEKPKTRPLREMIADYEARARAQAKLRENLPPRDIEGGRGRGYGR